MKQPFCSTRSLEAVALACALAWIFPAIAQQPHKRVRRILTPQTRSRPVVHPEHIVVTGMSRASATLHPAGQTTYSAERSDFASRSAQSVADMMATVPGVTFLQGNGPRDTVVSVRGSGARQSYGLKNIQVTEDGFPMTQPDGTARADLIDPHAYEGVDVFQGPASTLYGNYAINGAINFRTRNGANIHGLELGSDFGSFGTFNNYMTIGAGNKSYDFMLFGSDVRGNGFIPNSRYNTSTENMRLRISLTPSDRLILKFVNNVTDTSLPLRLSLDQFRTNPYQNGCANAASAAAGCASVNLLTNGAYGAYQTTSPQQAGLGRFDRRTITGLRWEQDFDPRTTWRTQFTYDQRHIDQPTSTTAFVGPFNSYNIQTDLTNHGHVGRTPLTSFVGASFDYMDYGYQVYNLTPQGGATRGALNSTSYGHQWNIGLRFQEDWQFAPRWHAVVGLGGTQSDVGAVETLYTHAASSTTQRDITVNRRFFQLAPEASLVYAPSQTLTLHTRVGTAYATPGYSSFFVTPQGTYGNNTQLKSETSLGFDLGAEWHPSPSLNIQATGFYEFYRNELVSQSAGVNTPAGSYTFNAPASQHRGVELGATWQPWRVALPGARLKLSYTYDNQIYTKYTEVLSNSTLARSFSRKGNLIPGVMPHFLDARVLYDQPDGLFQGLGAFAEVTWRSAFYIDNANILKAPSYALLNLEIHYDPPSRLGWIHRLHSYFEVQNVANLTYAAGATDISDTLLANGQQAGRDVLAAKTGSIYAGTPRAFFGGVRIRF
ncbi:MULTISPECIES: TonB-dependent receptor family protein [unclassified Gluconobacter]|uniref:TonB-dependent receptor family protein n=1 Tax=Gluconobacter TaxID=441 RepID=UPI00188B6122|nr:MULTISPECIES: TonB-dependent receptor [unclassified Gluconobacter]MBF0851719.1 TonB-dependent receptor [Gluconobacter sp. R75690]MBF0880432.1 TonB-dependent receptor [Gluconobacter sp. R75828]